MRRLPVYVVIDTSYSMSGEPIEAVKTGMDTLLSALRRDPHALETVYLSVITFSTRAQQIVPLTEIAHFTVPEITADGTTALGDALSLLAKSIRNDVIKTTAERRGDWKPLVFLMTDGAPTDDWKRGLRDYNDVNAGLLVACAAGADAKVDVLRQLTEAVVILETADTTTIQAFFQWVSASVSVSSKKVDLSKNDVGRLDELPPPPPEVNVAGF